VSDSMTEGRVVHYVPAQAEGDRPSHCLAAIVVRTWEPDGKWGSVKMAILPDGSNDRAFDTLTERPHGSILPVWKTSVPYVAYLRPADGTQVSHSYHDPRACPYT